jgi:hypothetical protein
MGQANPGSMSTHRQSVSWFADRAADAGGDVQRMPSTREEEEEAPVSIPAIHIDEPVLDGVPDPMADIDKTISKQQPVFRSFFGCLPQ